MEYEKIVKANFIERENRFVGRARLQDGSEVKVHVKNTGRCRELLVPECIVYLEDFAGRMGSRKMQYSLIAVEKKTADGKYELLINMDSQAPNKVVQEALENGSFRLPSMGELSIIRPETKYGSSRFDFYVEVAPQEKTAAAPQEKTAAALQEKTAAALQEKTAAAPAKITTPAKAFIEVKGVTLEENGFARFPDAPTERGLKHINELIEAAKEGYGAYIVFVIQMKGMHAFGPNYDTQPEFGQTLAKAEKAGVKILAYDCKVTPDSLVLDAPVNIILDAPVDSVL